jgi:hypothetical protein
MKKLYFFVLMLGITSILQSQVINFTDPVFKAKLINEFSVARDANNNYVNLDADNNGEIEVGDPAIATVNTLLIDNSNISDLTGIEYFTNLAALFCTGNNLTHLDLTSFSQLHTARVYDNQLATLNVTGLQHLYTLLCANNNLQELNLSGLPNLDQLHCNNNNLSQLDVAGSPNLRLLSCGANHLTSLNIAGLAHLEHIVCSFNQLSGLDVTGLENLFSLDCSDNHLVNLDASQLTRLNYFDCYNNYLQTIDVSNSPDLHILDCYNNSLASLYIKNGTYLPDITLDDNSNLSFICANAVDVDAIQAQLEYFGMDDFCTVSTDCNLANTVFSLSNGITVYPNPAHDILKISTAAKVLSVSVHNILGQLVSDKFFSGNEVEIDVSELKAGTYFVTVYSGSSQPTSKFIKL